MDAKWEVSQKTLSWVPHAMDPVFCRMASFAENDLTGSSRNGPRFSSNDQFRWKHSHRFLTGSSRNGIVKKPQDDTLVWQHIFGSIEKIFFGKVFFRTSRSKQNLLADRTEALSDSENHSKKGNTQFWFHYLYELPHDFLGFSAIKKTMVNCDAALLPQKNSLTEIYSGEVAVLRSLCFKM